MQPITNFAEAQERLRQFYDHSHEDYTLDNMQRLMAYLDNPQNKFKVVHVAGTSGKTSTAYYMAALLKAAGRKTGLTVSPHIDEMNERLQIDGRPLAEPLFCQALTEFLRLIAEAPVKPSWFELMVALAYWYFACAQVEYAVIEVGLGGLKDGTNVVTRADKVCVITDIGYDHIKTLGSTLAEIAGQKAGIIQSGNTVFTYRQGTAVMAVIEAQVRQKEGFLNVVEESENTEKTIPDYQFRNGFLAYRVYRFLQQRDTLPNLTSQALKKVRDLVIPGRMDVISLNGKEIVLDGAHNIQKMEAFVASFKKLYPSAKPAVLLAMRSGKEYKTVAPILNEFASRVIATTFKTSQDLPIKSMPADELAAAFEGQVSVRSIPDQKEAFKELLSGPEPICIVTGSLYLLGQIRNNEHLV